MGKRIYIKAFSLFVVLMTVFTLAACGETNQIVINSALRDVAISFAGEESATTVTQDITLPTAIGEAITIEWSSDKEAVISSAGVVVRPAEGEADETVVLTAVLTLGEHIGEISFTVLVLAEGISPTTAIGDVVLAGDSLNYISILERYITLGDIELPTSMFGHAIVWSSSNEDVIDTDGDVDRPEYGEADSTVILTATIGDMSVEFIVTVLAIAEKPDDLILEEAKVALLLPGGNIVIGNVELPSTVGQDGATVTWSSSHPDIIDEDGIVDRDDDATVEVTLTATILSGDETVTKEFVVTVVQDVELSTITEVRATEVGVNVRVRGIVTSSETGFRTHFIQDDNAAISIWTRNGEFQDFLNENLGKEIEVYGTRGIHSGFVQISPLTFKVIGDGVMPTAVNIDGHPITGAALLPYQAILVEMTGLVVSDIDIDRFGNYNITLLRISTGEVIVVRWDARVDLTEEREEFITEIKVGDYFDIISPLAWRGDDPRFLFNEGTILEAATPPEAEKHIVDAMALNLPLAIEEAITLVLPATGLHGSTITWVSSDNALINETTGEVIMPLEDPVIVTVTATVVFGAVEEVVVFEILVGELKEKTILEIINTSDDFSVWTQGVVTATENRHIFFIQDATAGIALDTDDEDLIAFLNENIGNLVEVFGVRDTNRDLRTIEVTEVNLIDAEVAAIDALNIDHLAIDPVVLLPYQGQLVEMTGLYVSSVSVDRHGNITVTFIRLSEGTEIALRWDSRVELSTEATALLTGIVVGDYFDIIAPLAWRSSPRFLFANSTILTPAIATTTDLLALDAMGLDIPTTITVAGTLVLPTAGGTNGSVITWVSSDNAIIDPTTGAVVIPANQVTVTLTATLVLETIEFVATFDVVVGVPGPDLFISEYIEGSSNNKAIELFNPTTQTIDLSIYSIELYFNGSTSVGRTLTLTGTLAPGAVIVIHHESAGPEITAVGDIISEVNFFGGDDTILLLKNGVVIDMFGVLGEDPGSYWTVGTGTTRNHTLVRDPSVTMPSATWDPTQWIVYIEDTFTHIGSHTTT